MSSTTVVDYGHLIDSTVNSQSSGDLANRVIGEASKLLAGSPLRRPSTLSEVSEFGMLDSRTGDLDIEIKETFALAMSDFFQARVLSSRMPLLAAAFRITKDQRYLTALTTQLEIIVSSWTPLQRPGWVLCQPKTRWTPGEWDGNSWLATGLATRAISDCLEIVPPGHLTDTLFGRVKRLLASELLGVVDDWKSKRPWYVSLEASDSNQWVLPNEAIIHAYRWSDKSIYREEYEVGISNLLKSLDGLGAAGEHDEGMHYGIFTVISLMKSARSAALGGDDRLIEHKFLKKFPLWYVHHYQPGRQLVNAFDSLTICPNERSDHNQRNILSTLINSTRDPSVAWCLNHLFDGPSEDLEGLLASALPPEEGVRPPLFGRYERAARINWRSSWDDDASGLWIRGGHARDTHDHCDRGHISYTVHGKPILIECGTADYGNPDFDKVYHASLAHNVLQTGPNTRLDGRPDFDMPKGLQQKAAVASLQVAHLSEKGGDAVFTTKEGYTGLDLWKRRLEWSETKLVIQDHVLMKQGCALQISFNWHLGTKSYVTITESNPRDWLISWNDTLFKIASSSALRVTQSNYPDRTLPFSGDIEDPSRTHTVILIETVDAINEINLTSTFTAGGP